MKQKLLPLNILHIFNDGFFASFLLLSPFIAKSLHLSLTQVGLLGTEVTIVEIASPSSRNDTLPFFTSHCKIP